MFELKSWIVDNLIRAYETGQFSRERTNLLAVDYMAKELLDIAEVEVVANATALDEPEEPGEDSDDEPDEETAE